jgi:hypothetical protein
LLFRWQAENREGSCLNESPGPSSSSCSKNKTDCNSGAY